MRTAAASRPAESDRDNEDWMLVSQDLIVVLDGATARTDTGCRHGVAWYAARLGGAIGAHAADPTIPLRDALALAITDVVAMHPECDLTHEGTPSAAVGIVRQNADQIEHLILGDVTTVLDLGEPEPVVIVDERVNSTAIDERLDANQYPIGSPEKQAALLTMKRAELAMRNKTGGFFVAAADPAVVSEAMVGRASFEQVRRIAILTDGAARAVCLFKVMTWSELLEALTVNGPDGVIDAVRQLESSDQDGTRWPRNKRSDDATAILIQSVVSASWNDNPLRDVR